MLGDIWVNVVLLESDGSIDAQTENWTTTEISQVKSEIQEGLKWWEDTLLLAPTVSPLHDLDFHIDFTHADNPVPTGYEPINRAESDEGLWIDSFLNRVGYNSGNSYHTDVTRWDHDQRIAHNAHWSYTIFVVDSSNDPDGKFVGDYFAYAYLGGPFTVMTYDNDGWGIDRMGQVLAHETGHIFYALDEYPGAGTYTERSGYYDTQNLNASDGHPSPGSRVASIMAEATLQNTAYASHTSSPSSFEMIGWKDSDSDGIFDALDVPLTLTGTGTYDSVDHRYEFSGSSAVQVLANLNPRGLGNDITTNTVNQIQYRLDGGAWQYGNNYGAYTSSVAQNVPVFSGGTHQIEIRTVFAETGLTSAVFSDVFTVHELLGAHAVNLNPGETETGIDFGNHETTPPTVSSLSPADNTMGISVDANLVITLSENIRKGTGDIVLKKLNDNSVVETIAVSDAKVTVSGATATIDPATTLQEHTGYYVEVASGAFEDLSGNDFAGISGLTVWNFTTGDFTAPTADIVNVTPDPRTSAVSSITIVFSEAVVGFDLADLTLTRSSDSNLLTDAQTLSTSDNVTWVLGDLSSLTSAAGIYQLQLTATSAGIQDLAGNALTADASESWMGNATVSGRHIFYNRSYFDDPSRGKSDDDAIAPDKRALLPGQTAQFVNYTSYSRGINGILVDVAHLPAAAALTAADFTFKVGNSNSLDTWTTAPAAARHHGSTGQRRGSRDDHVGG